MTAIWKLWSELSSACTPTGWGPKIAFWDQLPNWPNISLRRYYMDKHRTILDCLLVFPIYLADCTPFYWFQPSARAMWDCLLLAAGPSRSPDLKSVTIYRNTVTSTLSSYLLQQTKNTPNAIEVKNVFYVFYFGNVFTFFYFVNVFNF